MKLIIDIPKERLDSIKHFGIKQNEVSMLEKALISGTPLDDIKAEITKIPTHNMLKAYEVKPKVFQILDNIGKAESEESK